MATFNGPHLSTANKHGVLSILQSHIDRMIICHAYLLSLEEGHGTGLAAAAHAREERRTKFAIVICSFLTSLPPVVTWGDDDVDQKLC